MNVELVAFTQGNPKNAYKGAAPADVCAVATAQCYGSEPNPRTVKGAIRKGHESIIEHASFTFLIEEVSRAFLAQVTRHRIASFSVRSQRYCKETEFEYIEPPSVWEGSEYARDVFEASMQEAQVAYDVLLKEGVKPEDARMVLPNACFTSMVMTMNARSLRNFFRLRLDNHAQWEIRLVAQTMFDLVMEVAPALFEDIKQEVTTE